MPDALTEYQIRCLAWYNDISMERVKHRHWTADEIKKAISEASGRDIDIYEI